jgi:hypothetical protein
VLIVFGQDSRHNAYEDNFISEHFLKHACFLISFKSMEHTIFISICCINSIFKMIFMTAASVLAIILISRSLICLSQDCKDFTFNTCFPNHSSEIVLPNIYQLEDCQEICHAELFTCDMFEYHRGIKQCKIFTNLTIQA